MVVYLYLDSTSLLLVREEKNIKLLTRWAPHNVMIWGSTTIILSRKLFSANWLLLPYVLFVGVFPERTKPTKACIYEVWKWHYIFFRIFGFVQKFKVFFLFSNRGASCACKMSHFSKKQASYRIKNNSRKKCFPIKYNRIAFATKIHKKDRESHCKT